MTVIMNNNFIDIDISILLKTGVVLKKTVVENIQKLFFGAFQIIKN